jgi:hypothetical protein
MNGRFHTFATVCSYAYLLRVPLLIGAILVALPPVSLWGPPQSLLENLFVLTSLNIFWAMFVALTLTWSTLVAWRIVLLNGQERFGIEQWKKEDTLTEKDVFYASLPALSLLVCALVERHRALWWIPLWKWLGAALGGALVAYVAGFVGLVLSITLAPRYPRHPADQRFRILFPFSKKILGWAEHFRLIPLRDPDRFARWAKVHVPADVQAGYLDVDGHLYPGHWLSLMLLVVSLIVYEVVGSIREGRLGIPSNVPAIAYVLILMLVLNWLLSIIAFFLDRYRVPIIVPIVLFCALGGQSSQSDHYFAIHSGIATQSVSPVSTLTGHTLNHPLAKNPNGVVVVATAGGGIQAAGWTAQVLTGLQDECSTEPQSNFADSIAAISAVSGGAVGTLFFVNQYQAAGASPGFQPRGPELKQIVEQAEAPGLSDIAWALVYIDPFRMFFPYALVSPEKEILDRGFVLEQTWRHLGSIDANLSDWRDGVTRGYRPAVIFNSTLAETGQPFLLATTDFDIGTVNPTRQTLTQAFPGSDIPVVTAARLAASFPYVSPATRPLTNKPEYHVVDGGYYDNFGVDNLSSWLDQAFMSLANDAQLNVLVIQIRSFPTGKPDDPVKKGWFYQSYAPLGGLMSVRTTAQLVRDRDELSLLQAKWFKISGLHIDFATFEFSGKNAPLSWQLTQPQKHAIETAWQSIHDQGDGNADLKTVHSFCNPQTPGSVLAKSEPR